MRQSDPLVVCGWQPRVSSLAVFSDGSAMDLNRRNGSKTLPVTVTHGGHDVAPGFALMHSDLLIVTGADGTEAYINGQDGSDFIAASYDPFANDGDGQFDISVGYDLDSPDTPTAATTNATPVTIHARLEYCTVEMTSDPTATIRSRVRWKPEFPDPLTNRVRLRRYAKYRISHRLLPLYQAGEVTYDLAIFELSEQALQHISDQ